MVKVLAILLTLLAAVPVWAEDTPNWEGIAVGIERDVARRLADMDALNRRLPEFQVRLDAALAEADRRLAGIVVVRGVAGDTPWAVRTLLFQVRDLGQYVRERTKPLRLTKSILEKIRDDKAAMLRLGDSHRNAFKGSRSLLGELTPKIQQTTDRAQSLIAAVSGSLARAEEMAAAIGELARQLRRDFIDRFTQSLVTRVQPPLGEFGMAVLDSRMRSWSSDAPRFFVALWRWTSWGRYLTAGLALSAGILAGGRWLSRRREQGDESRPLRELIPFSLGLGFLCAQTLGVAPALYNLAWGAVFLTGAALLLDGYVSRVKMWGLAGLNALGLLAQMACLPPEALCLGWPVVLLAVGGFFFRSGLRVSAAACMVLAGLALAGLGEQAGLAIHAWFLFILAVGLTRFLRESMAQAGGVWLRYVYPLSVTVLAVACLAWFFLFLGGPEFVSYAFTLTLDLGRVRITLDSLALMALLFFAVRLVLAWFKAYLEKASFGAKPLDQALAHTIHTALAYVLWVGYLLAVLDLGGISLQAVTWIASGLSVGVGFGLKDIINNFVSGIIILFGGSIKKGDVIQTGKLLGEVVTVSVRNTTVRTLDNSMVIIPNSSFLRGEIINWSYQDRRIRLTIPVSVIPGTKVKKVRKILLTAAKEHELVLKDPAPSVVLRQFGKLGLDFELYVWIEDFRDKFKVESDVAMAIDQMLQESRVSVAFQSAKTKYKPKGSEEVQLKAAREALREKRHAVFSRMRGLKRVHMRTRWGLAAQADPRDDGA